MKSCLRAAPLTALPCGGNTTTRHVSTAIRRKVRWHGTSTRPWNGLDAKRVGARDMPGTAGNIDARIDNDATRKGYDELTDLSDAPLAAAAGYMVRQLASGRPLPLQPQTSWICGVTSWKRRRARPSRTLKTRWPIRRPLRVSPGKSSGTSATVTSWATTPMPRIRTRTTRPPRRAGGRGREQRGPESARTGRLRCRTGREPGSAGRPGRGTSFPRRNVRRGARRGHRASAG